VEAALRGAGGIRRAVGTLAGLRAWGHGPGAAQGPAVERWLAALTGGREPFAGLSLERPRLMGVINVTPDSFSDGGDWLDTGRAVAHGLALLEAGADILDIGGESTRPGAAPVSPDEEAGRIVPVIAALAGRGALVSVDTRHALVMRAALAAGARIVNDISGLAGDGDSLAVVARAGAPVVLMHMQGEPGTMQAAPSYQDAALDVFDWLEARVAACRAAGVRADGIAVDPGIGFGKTVEHNLEIMRQLTLFHGLGVPLLVGVSRKSFIGRLSRGEPPKARLPGSLAAGLAAWDQGAHILRIHDAGETAQARAVWEGLHPSGQSLAGDDPAIG
jgi:dihydropteroate synthase